ncbi:Swt1 family HEPN domain-containing protein [Kineococcus arenarius]|uniref:Swt1 family HEPN domain-containing protein n=1 Tax=Kineococcus sp. SYSU DK007 TaxID=3383128 RepID=UPI003D7D386B
MAASNRNRIDRGFELLSEGLDAYIFRVLDGDVPNPEDWPKLLQVKDTARHGGAPRKIDRHDPQAQLRLLTESIPGPSGPGWRPFEAQLGHLGKGYASELREWRNQHSHFAPASSEDAQRVLDSAERLLRVVGAVGQAESVKQLRIEIRQAQNYEDQRRARDAARAAREAAPDLTSAGLPAWRTVVQPHPDVAAGNFRAAEFAADLYTVARANRGDQRADADADYTDPVQFFRRTYLTEGLKQLLTGAVDRVTGDRNAAPVVNLQTNFGGGKTHSMLALWHIVSDHRLVDYPQDVQELLRDSGLDDVAGRVNRAALVGTHLEVTGNRDADDEPLRRTIWGELAWQLGGAEGYAMLADADAASNSPGGALDRLLQRYAPAVILIDEWVAYARLLSSGDGLPAGEFQTQFTFAQTLTEAVKRTPGVLLAVSIPASSDGGAAAAAVRDEEVGGASGRSALTALLNVVGRMADQWRPATAEESFEIVRRRLFVEPEGPAHGAITAVARATVDFYRKYPDHFPREAREAEYVERIRRSYPLHPELFDRLYTDWSGLERFQRTRGVLRLLNTVVAELWQSEDASPLIVPGGLPLRADTVLTELTQYLEDHWKVVVDTDVDGPDCTPGKVDESNRPLYGARQVTRRLARTVFFGSAPTLKSANKGIDRRRAFLGTALPGDQPGNFHSALSELAARATYYYDQDNRSWFLPTPNVTRQARDHAEGLHPEDVWAVIVRRLQQQPKQSSRGIAAVHVTDDPGDVPDGDDVRLVVIHPRHTYDKKTNGSSPAGLVARAVVEREGTRQRIRRNQVVALAGDAARMAELDAAVRDFLSWQWIVENERTLNLSTAQREQAVKRRESASALVDTRITATYHWVLAPEQLDATEPWVLRGQKADKESSDLVDRAAAKLTQLSMLSVQCSAANVGHHLRVPLARAWEPGHISFGNLWLLYATYPYLPRLRGRNVLAAGVRSHAGRPAWETDTFALAEGYDEDTGTYRGLWLPTDPGEPPAATDALLLVQPDRAWAQREADLRAAGQAGAAPTPGAGPAESSTTGAPSAGTSGPAAPAPLTRFHGSKQFDPATIGKDFANVAAEVIAQLTTVAGVRLEVRLDIQAVAADGFDEAKRRVVSENATVLKFETHGFEER